MAKKTIVPAPHLQLTVAEQIPDAATQELARGPERWAGFVVGHAIAHLKRVYDRPTGRNYNEELARRIRNPFISFYNIDTTFRPTDSSKPEVRAKVRYKGHEDTTGSLGELTLRQTRTHATGAEDKFEVVFNRVDTGSYTGNRYEIRRLIADERPSRAVAGQRHEYHFDGPLGPDALQDPHITKALGALAGGWESLQNGAYVLDRAPDTAVTVSWLRDSGDFVVLPRQY